MLLGLAQREGVIAAKTGFHHRYESQRREVDHDRVDLHDDLRRNTVGRAYTRLWQPLCQNHD